MTLYRVEITKSAAKAIQSLPPSARRRVTERLRDLAADPRPNGVRKLQGRDGYRVRVGDYRVIYTVQDDVVLVTVIRVGHRRDVYER